jgi:hypothetical protein
MANCGGGGNSNFTLPFWYFFVEAFYKMHIDLFFEGECATNFKILGLA